MARSAPSPLLFAVSSLNTRKSCNALPLSGCKLPSNITHMYKLKANFDAAYRVLRCNSRAGRAESAFADKSAVQKCFLRYPHSSQFCKMCFGSLDVLVSNAVTCILPLGEHTSRCCSSIRCGATSCDRLKVQFDAAMVGRNKRYSAAGFIF